MARDAQMMAVPFAALVTILAGCGSAVSVPPTAPTSAQSPAPAATVVGERWNLTTTLRSITGPKTCNAVMKAELGETFLWHMTIERSGGSVRLIVALVGEPGSDRYEGTQLEDVMTAAIEGRFGKTVCEGTMVDVFAEAHVSGRFSEDGRALTAEELKSYTFSSGDTLRAYYDWNAARQ